jgi:hypothetical protein
MRTAFDLVFELIADCFPVLVVFSACSAAYYFG